MCGIAGIYDPTRGLSLDGMIRSMTDIIQHRGPDSDGFYVDDPVALGMRRLSIIDVAGGDQPIFNEDNSFVIVFNGEIYNFQSLRRLLEGRHQFRTNSDTEVILHLYEEFGVDMLSRLQGMFAFAIWDSNRQRLFVARDQLGVKPLYYTQTGSGALVFASEIKALLQHPNVPREVNRSALNQYLTLQYVPAPATMFAGISKLPPGHYLLASETGCAIHQYYQLPEITRQMPASVERVSRDLYDRLLETVRAYLISDVPLGAFLSGGIDSATIVGLMSKLIDRPVETFSVGFESRTSGFNETSHARTVANAFGANHHELVIGESALDLLPHLVWHLDEPLADRAALPTYLVSRLARQYVTVALTGEGGDELFAGYPRYQALKLAHWHKQLPAPLRAGLGALVSIAPSSTGIARRYRHVAEADLFYTYIGQQSNFAPAAKRALLAPDFAAALPIDAPLSEWGELESSRWLENLLTHDSTHWLPDDLLMKADKMSMAASLEARVPFLDTELIAFVAQNIPVGLRLHHLTTKYILKDAVKDLLPPEIVKRRKQGFDVPLAEWLGGRRDFLHDLLLSPAATERGYFNAPFVRGLIEQATAAELSPVVGGQLWNLICLELWHRLYIDQDESWLALRRADETVDYQ
jgi:asparagine synthase (glutamine-hydrolysing)